MLSRLSLCLLHTVVHACDRLSHAACYVQANSVLHSDGWLGSVIGTSG
jgi:hypothetical protein